VSWKVPWLVVSQWVGLVESLLDELISGLHRRAGRASHEDRGHIFSRQGRARRCANPSAVTDTAAKPMQYLTNYATGGGSVPFSLLSSFSLLAY
jgi:hypothetical protein